MAKMGQEHTIEPYRAFLFVGGVLKQQKGAVYVFLHAENLNFIAEFGSNITTKTICKKKQKHVAISRWYSPEH